MKPLEDEAGVLVKGEVPGKGGAAAGGEVKNGHLGMPFGEQVLHALSQGVQVQAVDGLEVLLTVLPQGGVLAVLVEIIQGDTAGLVAVAPQALGQDAGGGGLARGGGAAEEDHLGVLRLRPKIHLYHPLVEGLFLRGNKGLGIPLEQFRPGGKIDLFHNRNVFHRLCLLCRVFPAAVRRQANFWFFMFILT